MTKNRLEQGDYPAPFAPRASDAWQVAAAKLPSLVSLVQPSNRSAKIRSDGIASLYDRTARAPWLAPNVVNPGVLGPNLLPNQSGGRYFLQWPATSGTNPLRSPAGLALPAVGTIFIVAQLASYAASRVFLKSTTTVGNYINLAVNSSGEIEAKGAAAATIAKSAVITPYAKPILIMLSWSGTITRVSVNGSLIGGTTTGAYVPNADPLDLAAAFDGGDKLYAAGICGVDFHDAAYDAQRAAFVTLTGQSFSTPFTIAWNFSDLGVAKLVSNVDPSTAADGNVTTITETALGMILTEATAPPSKASADLNGRASLQFESANSEKIRNTAYPASIPSGTANSWIFVACEQNHDVADTTSVTLVGYGSTGSNTGRSIRRISDGTTAKLRITTNNTGSFVDGTFNFSGKHVVAGGWVSGVEYARADGSAIGQLATPFNTTAAARFCLGCSQTILSSPVGFWNGKLQRVIVAKDLTQADIDLIEGRLAYELGTQNLLPNGHAYQNATFTP